VVVVTPTRGRPERLWRAAASVAAQRQVTVRHIVVGDDCPALADPAFVALLTGAFPHLRVLATSPDTHPQLQDDYRWARVARLRNFGVRHSDAALIAHLDDDNVWDADHLASLVDALHREPEAQVAHSWRRLCTPGGEPYVIPPGTDPWNPDPETAARAYRLMVDASIIVPGSPVLRDRMSHNGVLFARVDTNEMLIRRSLFDRIPFPETFSRWKQKIGIGDDALFVADLVRQHVPVVCSERVTVTYFMGGNSNG
jgi:hypothetical protein